MADFTAFTAVAKKVLLFSDGIAGISGSLITTVTPIILAGLTTLIMWHGFNILRGAGGQHHFLDIFAKSLRAFLVFNLALAGGLYATNVVESITDLRDDLTSKVAVASGAGAVAPTNLASYAMVDASMEKAAQAANKAFEWGYDNISLNPLKPNLTGVVAIICAGFMMGCMVIYSFIACANLLLMDFALKIIFGVGPLFVACFAFQATARFFDAWLGGVLKYVFTAVVIACVIGLGNGIMDGFATGLQNSADTMDFLAVAFSSLGASGVLIGIASRAPAIAGDIVGGIGINAIGPAVAQGPLAAISSMTKLATQGASNAISYGAGKVANSGAARAVTGSSLGQKAIQATQGIRNAGGNALQGARNFSNAVSGKGAASSSLGSTTANAYRIGAGGGTGSIAASGHTSGRSPLDNMVNRRPIPAPLPKLYTNI